MSLGPVGLMRLPLLLIGLLFHISVAEKKFIKAIEDENPVGGLRLASPLLGPLTNRLCCLRSVAAIFAGHSQAGPLAVCGRLEDAVVHPHR